VFEAKQLPSMAGQELASRVTCPKSYGWDKGSVEVAVSPWSEQMGESDAHAETRKHRIVAYDYGIKQNILRLLVDHQCEVFVVPAQTSAEDVLEMKPDGVFLSNGPGDPEPSATPWKISRSSSAMFPCLEFAWGTSCAASRSVENVQAEIRPSRFESSGENLLTEQVEITAQNHGFCVDPESLRRAKWEVTHINLNDHTNEGMRHQIIAAIFRPISSGSFARPARFALSVHGSSPT